MNDELPISQFDMPGHSRYDGERLVEKKEEIMEAYKRKAQDSFLLFVRGITIDGQNGPKVFENCMALFQRECFEDLADHLETLRDGNKPNQRRWWIERTKKAGKDSDLALIIIWLIAFPHRPFYAQVGAADREQAGIVKERIIHLLHWNEWLNDYIEIVKWQIRSKKKMASGNPEAVLDIMASDISGAHGGTPDLLIINELSHVTKWEFLENLMDNADGVAHGMVIIATNAGFKGTKAEVWKLNALKNESWTCHCWMKPAPWHDKATIEEAKSRNTPSRFKRLWRGLWSSGKGDALDEEDIDATLCLEGPTIEPEAGWMYLGGLDLGVSHDHAGLVIIGVNIDQQLIKVMWMQAWEPLSTTGEVDLIDVEDNCFKYARHYRLHSLWYDPHQAKLMAQRLRRKGVAMCEMSFTPGNLTKMAVRLVQVMKSRKLQAYEDKDKRLRRDFGKFNIVEKTYGYRLEAVSDEFGHADVGTALVIALPAAVDILNGRLDLVAGDTLVDLDEEELSAEEIEAMPDELREIYDMDEEDRERNVMERANDPFYDPLEDLF